MSINSLEANEDFKHRFQDDMESFYYMVLYASVRWLPHGKLDEIKERISKFFDENEAYRGKFEGGHQKFSNRERGRFETFWGFENEFLREWLKRVRKLQLPAQNQPSWTPRMLHDIWKSIDEEDLAKDDRKDHLGSIQRQLINNVPPATRTSTRSTKITSQKVFDLIPVNVTSGTSSKRRVGEAEAGFESNTDALKRQRN